jgi:hypothetical protein
MASNIFLCHAFVAGQNQIMKKILKEPLLHFLFLGAMLFVIYSMMQTPGRNDEPGQIVVTQGQIDHLAAAFARTWQRLPGTDELAGLVRERVREEVYYREAMAMGLDKDDTVIRRRLRQKMQFISDDIAARSEPTDEELNTYLQTHADMFRLEPRFSFNQVYLNPEKHGDDLERDSAQLLTRLHQSDNETDLASLGDPLILQQQYDGMPASEVAKLFGKQFAAKLGELVPGQWQGPVESGYGVHLVLVSERSEGRLPALAEVRDSVRREWDNAQRLEANQKFYQELLKRYTVTIEGLEPTAEQNKLASGEAQ